MSTKPGDAPKGPAEAGRKPTNPEVKIPGRGDKYTELGDDSRALGENIGGVTGSHKVIVGETAPEVSQGPWRERAFMPRGTMGQAEILAALRAGLENAKRHPPARALELLRQEWIPVLRQAVEQAGGDGIDCWLLAAFKPPGRTATAPLLGELIAGFTRMRSATDVAQLTTEAAAVIEAVDRAGPRPRRISFKQMERELEGKVEIHELLLILFSSDDELKARTLEVGSAMESLRGQLKSMPGSKPDGIYSNFARLKAEARVLAAELGRRSKPSK